MRRVCIRKCYAYLLKVYFYGFGPLQSSEGPGFLGPCSLRGSPIAWGRLSPRGPRLTWGPFESRWPHPGRNSGYVPDYC